MSAHQNHSEIALDSETYSPGFVCYFFSFLVCLQYLTELFLKTLISFGDPEREIGERIREGPVAQRGRVPLVVRLGHADGGFPSRYLSEPQIGNGFSSSSLSRQGLYIRYCLLREGFLKKYILFLLHKSCLGHIIRIICEDGRLWQDHGIAQL